MKTVLSAVFAGALILSGCSTTNKSKTALEVKSSSDVRITHVSVWDSPSGTTVSGTLRPARSSIRLAGHVDVEFVAADGTVLKQVAAEPNVGHFSKHANMRRPEFSITTPLDTQPAGIRVIHHADVLKTCGL